MNQRTARWDLFTRMSILLPHTATTGIATVMMLSLLADPLTGAAQEHQAARPKHHHYKLIDMGTFGGPQSYFNSLDLTDVFMYGSVFYNMAKVRNGHGIFVGFADTASRDPDPAFCYVADCFVTHAFEWRNGVKTDLGVLPGGSSSAAFSINSNGLVAGNSQIGETDPLIPGVPELRAVIWKNRRIKDLGTLGGSSSFSQAVNNRGQVTGLALNGIPDPFSFYYQFLYCLPFSICLPNATQTRAFVWDEEGGMQDIGTLGGPDAFPSVINNRGQVAGYSYTNDIPNPTFPFVPTFHPFLWEKGKGMKDLGTLGGTQTASVNGLNERGEVVGGLLLAGDVLNHPFLWDGAKLIDLVTPPFEASLQGEARWINQAGEVVGSAGLVIAGDDQGPQTHGFLWRNGAMTDLGMIPGSPCSQADFINSKSQVVGGSFSCDHSSSLAFLWDSGSIIDLNMLIPANTPLYLYWAPYIDDQGVIGALGLLANGDSHAVLLMPCDEDHPNIEGCDYSMVGGND